jgi:hypothetical protein
VSSDAGPGQKRDKRRVELQSFHKGEVSRLPAEIMTPSNLIEDMS